MLCAFLHAGKAIRGTSKTGFGNELWLSLSEPLRREAQRLRLRLVPMIGQIAQAVKNAPLTSTADQRGVMTGTKAMRAALKLRVEPTSVSV